MTGRMRIDIVCADVCGGEDSEDLDRRQIRSLIFGSNLVKVIPVMAACEVTVKARLERNRVWWFPGC